MVAPVSLDELKKNATQLAGKKFLEFITPAEVKKNFDKGIIGQISEKILGAESGSLPQPDFLALGVELKTLPIIQNNQVKESTFVCMASLLPEKISFFDSLVYQKLKHVLFVPYQAEKNIPLLERRIGTPFFWQPDEKELAILKQDYEELMQHIIMGNITSLRATQGEALQIRPKGANRRALTEAINEKGESIFVNARGFYLRQRFTQQIVNRFF